MKYTRYINDQEGTFIYHFISHLNGELTIQYVMENVLNAHTHLGTENDNLEELINAFNNRLSEFSFIFCINIYNITSW